MVSADSLASPDPPCTMDLARSPSPCLNLDTLSSDDAEKSVIPRDISLTVLCGSEDDHTPVSSDQVLSDVDLPVASDSRTVSSGLVLQTDGVYGAPGVYGSTPLVFRIRPRQSGLGPTSRDYQSLVPPRWSDQFLCRGGSDGNSLIAYDVRSTFEEMEDSSVPLSPNCVQAGCSQEMPAD